jgi:transcriptional regulator with XRE-family HTH domain
MHDGDRAEREAASASHHLAQQVRAARNGRGWTLEQASKHTGLARSTLWKIENGRMSPTYDVLCSLASGFGVEIGRFFSPIQTGGGPGRRSITSAGSGRTYDEPQYRNEVLAAELANKRMLPMRTQVKARSMREFGEWSRHPGEEVLLVLTGEVEVHTEFYEPTRLGPGDTIYLDSRMGHAVLSLSDEDATVFWVTSATA